MKLHIALSMVGLVYAHVGVAADLPNLSGQTQLEGSTVFMSPKKLAWHLATDFAAELECSSSSRSPNQSCVLNIMNVAPVKAREAMGRLQSESGHPVVSITALDSRIVSSVQESLSGEVTRQGGALPRFPQTLQMSSTAPYYSYMFRVKSGDGDALLKKFDAEGLGTFVSKVSLLTERVGDYLALQFPERAKARLAEVQGRTLTRAEAEYISRQALLAGGFVYSEMSEGEALSLGSLLLRVATMEPTKKGYRMKGAALAALESVLVDQTSAPALTTCEVTLQLKAGARPTVSCSEDFQ